jgi:hypothetical protein
MNPFKVDDVVRTTNGDKSGGIVKYIACNMATVAGGKSCDKKTCNHYVKDFVWVKWTDGKVFSYEHQELAIDKIVPTETKIITETPTNKAQELAIPDIMESKIDFDLYNGITEVRYTRDGRGYTISKPIVVPDPIAEQELDFDAYNSKGLVRKKK